jgi:hypothetical protein
MSTEVVLSEVVLSELVLTEAVLTEAVRTWAIRKLPGQPDGADLAAAVARASYSRHASLTGACRVASSFVSSWGEHPSQWKADEDVVLQAS